MPGERVVGVDFSGARRPGESIWIAEGRLRGDGLVIDRCRSARDALGEREREAVLSALVNHVTGAAVVGFDFPFGLPRRVVDELDGLGEWSETVEWIATFETADEFAERCQAVALSTTGGERTYLRRATDEPHDAKSPYHFFTYKQAFHGTRDVLGPLLDRGAAVAPMVEGDEPTVVEVYPAGTLRRLGLPDQNYKQRSEAARRAREAILSGLESETVTAPRVRLGEDADREAMLADDGGDALDSVIAAVAAARALERGFEVGDDRHDPLEGHIYV